jgi:serine/threonine-protein kinase
MEPGELAPDTRVGEFVVVRTLSDGPLSAVYETRGVGGSDPVRAALKLAKLAVSEDPTLAERFHRESTLAERVSHPALVPILATGVHDGHPWLAQPFIDGGTLADQIAAHGRLEPASACALVQGIAGGLDALHEAGIVHRDLNPSNILLGEDEAPLISDFGLVKDLQGRTLTVVGSVLGTSDYIAPEQIRGTEVGPGADIYALGCVAFELLTGAPPFADRDGMMVIWAHLSEDPGSLRARCPELPAELDPVVARALRKDPADRPLSAGAFAQALSHACAASPTSGS